MGKLLRKLWWDRGLVYKITCTVTCLLIVPTVLIGAFYYQSYKSSLIKETDNRMKEQLDGVTDIMDANLDIVQGVMERIGYGQELLYFMDRQNNISQREKELFLSEIQDEWINIRYEHPNMFSRMILYSSNQMLSVENAWKFQIFPLEEFEERPDWEGKLAYGQVRYQSNTLSEGFADPAVTMEEIPVLPVYMKVENVSTGETIGIVELDILLEKLTRLSGFKNETDSFYFIGICDQENALLIANDHVPDFLDEEDLSFLAGYDWMVPQVTVQRFHNEDTTFRIAGSLCARTGMRRFILISEEVAVSTAKDMIWRVGLVAMAGIFCVMLAIYYLIRKMLRRLLDMDEVMGKVEEGNFQALIREDGYHDEISKLIHHFNQMTMQLQNVMQQIVAQEKAKKDAELRALQARINPHFLYNTLETLRMQCEIDRYHKVGNGLLALAGMMRYAIKWDSYEVPFSKEWKNLQNYISIMALRFDDDFQCDMDCEEGMEEIIVPKMFLQPIVENSFLHGFKGSRVPWKLYIYAFCEAGYLKIFIRDNGCGIPEDRLQELHKAMDERIDMEKEGEGRSSIGLVNVLQRMDMVCGRGSEIHIENGSSGGIEIEILIRLTAAETVGGKDVSNIGGG